MNAKWQQPTKIQKTSLSLSSLPPQMPQFQNKAMREKKKYTTDWREKLEREIRVAITRFPERDQTINNNNRVQLRKSARRPTIDNKPPQFLFHFHTTTGSFKEFRTSRVKLSKFLFHESIDPLHSVLSSSLFILRPDSSIKVRIHRVSVFSFRLVQPPTINVIRFRSSKSAFTCSVFA